MRAQSPAVKSSTTVRIFSPGSLTHQEAFASEEGHEGTNPFPYMEQGVLLNRNQCDCPSCRRLLPHSASSAVSPEELHAFPGLAEPPGALPSARCPARTPPRSLAHFTPWEARERSVSSQCMHHCFSHRNSLTPCLFRFEHRQNVAGLWGLAGLRKSEVCARLAASCSEPSWEPGAPGAGPSFSCGDLDTQR